MLIHSRAYDVTWLISKSLKNCNQFAAIYCIYDMWEQVSAILVNNIFTISSPVLCFYFFVLKHIPFRCLKLKREINDDGHILRILTKHLNIWILYDVFNHTNQSLHMTATIHTARWPIWSTHTQAMTSTRYSTCTRDFFDYSYPTRKIHYSTE